MYLESELAFMYFQSFSQELLQLDELCCSQSSNISLGSSGNLVSESTISDYNLGGEGDLFKAPEPILEEPGIDPMVAAISMISCGDNVIAPQTFSVADIESSIERGQILSDVFYECRKDLLAKEGNEVPISKSLHIKTPEVKNVENFSADQKFLSENQIQKSVSSNYLSSMDRMHEAPPRPHFLDFSVVDIESVYGMRRSFSEGDIKTLGNGNINIVRSPTTKSCYPSEDRWEKLSRYRSKRSKRNFGRKIKYACRKALADNQPRIRGRFAKTEELESFKKH